MLRTISSTQCRLFFDHGQLTHPSDACKALEWAHRVCFFLDAPPQAGGSMQILLLLYTLECTHQKNLVFQSSPFQCTLLLHMVSNTCCAGQCFATILEEKVFALTWWKNCKRVLNKQKKWEQERKSPLLLLANCWRVIISLLQKERILQKQRKFD